MKPTYANIVATIALFVALGGGAYAATQLQKNSVGSRQLKKDSVTGAKVRDGSLTGSDIDASSLGRVPDAAHASNADSATSASSASHATSASQATSADQAANSARLDGHSSSEFITPLLGHVRNVPEATTETTEWGSITGVSAASPKAEDVEMVTPYHSTMYVSDFTVYTFDPIGEGGHVDIRLIVNGEETELACAFTSPLQAHCINPPGVYVKVPGGSTVVIRIHEEPNSGPSPGPTPTFSFQAAAQLSTTAPQP